MNENQVVIYSNGIADFQRCYDVTSASPTRISIPVRQDHLADVLASFNVYGDVALESPPTYRPSNELEGNISINANRVLEDLGSSLSGAKVEVQRAGETISGTLVGLHQEEEGTAGEPIHPKSLIVLTEQGLRRCLLREVQSLRFLDEDVQTEIDKALQRNYQRIKPNSTFVELGLSTERQQADAIVQYTIPAAAWKISYRIRMNEGRATVLQGFAIVDNNTDEDWNDFRVSVVTGEPITFSTDLADSKSPARRHVNLVSEMALGAVEVDADEEMFMANREVADGAVSGAMRSANVSHRLRRIASSGGTLAWEDADTSAAEVQEVGDFNIFESQSLVSIPAKRSTVIPVFRVEVAESRPVLYYKFEDHPSRPYRAIEFTNQADFSLGRGVCTVFENTAYSGNCVVPALKPGETRLLTHALETGVGVRRDQRSLRKKVVALRFSKGFCYTSTREHRITHYLVKNNRAQSFELVLDHVDSLLESDVTARIVRNESDEPLEPASRLDGGRRYKITLAGHEQLTVTLEEQRIRESHVELVSDDDEPFKIGWLQKNIVQTNGPLALDQGVQECLRIDAELQAKRREITSAFDDVKRLSGRQDRLRDNIRSGGQDELTARWRSELDEAEQAIRAIEEERIPTLRDEDDALKEQLAEALKSLSAEWSTVGE